MSVLKVGALKSPSSSSNNIVLNADGTISSGDGGAIPSNNYITGTFLSNNYFEEEKVTLGSFVDISDYDLSSLGGSLIHASATGGTGGNTYSIPSTASAVYIWAQGAGGISGTARSDDTNSDSFAGSGGGGSCAVTKITIGHQPHSTLTDLYCEFNPQGEAVVYIGTSNSGVEIARGYKGMRGVDNQTTSNGEIAYGGWLQKNVSGKSISSTSTSAYTQTTITDIVNPGTSRAHFPKFLGPYLEHGEGVQISSRFSVNNVGYATDGPQAQGYSGGGLFSRGILGETNSVPANIFNTTSHSIDGINAHTLKWSFGVGGGAPISINENRWSTSPRPAGEGGYACVVIIVR
jgi:hypothetical protein